MIKINGKEANFIRHFNDGTQQLRLPKDFNVNAIENKGVLKFEWYYDSDEELLTLQYLVSYYRSVSKGMGIKFILFVPYLPNARMDRVQEYFDVFKSTPREVFTLKFFCDIINNMHFDQVQMYDVHSNVAKSLLDNSVNIDPEPNIIAAMRDSFSDSSFIVCFPDIGALKRYGSMKCFRGINLVYGVKCRDWHTGHINGITLVSADNAKIANVEGQNIMVIDDIIGSGQTLSIVVRQLAEQGAKKICVEASHVENNAVASDNEFILPLLDDGTVSAIYTSNSILRKHHEKIHVFTNY